jgi:glycerophosphoryl diester phosphodiesterase
VVIRIGHRGAAGHEPENTLLSFGAAVSLGADMVELDVHRCASGELVVIHDETVDRTTDGSGVVAELTLRELKTLDAGKGERIPTLGEVFAALRGRVGVNIELKGGGTAELVHDILTRTRGEGGGYPGDVLVTSFDWGMLGRMRELSGETLLGPLVYEDVEGALTAAEGLCAYSVNPYHRKIDAAYVAEAHALGLRVYPWTVNEPGDIRRVTGFGVDGVISDFPDRI